MAIFIFVFLCFSVSLCLCLSLSHTHTCLVKIENCKHSSTLGPLTLTLMLYIHLSLSFHSPLRIVVFSFSCDRKMLRDRKGLDEGHRISKLGDEIWISSPGSIGCTQLTSLLPSRGKGVRKKKCNEIIYFKIHFYYYKDYLISIIKNSKI